MAQRPRVLYIDDDAALARLVAKALDRGGYDMVHAPSGAAGLERLSREPFDAVTLDHHMPGEIGLDVLKQIRVMPEAPPVLYVTGSEHSQVAVAALKAGAVDYVWKDVQGHFRELLVEALGTALRQEALRRAKEAADHAVREARDRAELMLQEVNHRVANSLALVAGFAHLQAAAIPDPVVRGVLEDMQARIKAIAGVHRRLYTSQNIDRVELDAYLASLVEDLEASMRASGRDLRIDLQTDAVIVPTDKAVSLGVIVTELLTNAYKYAYPPGVHGEVRVRLTQDGDKASLVIEDDGVGWNGEGQTTGTGLGMRVVKAMASSLRSKIEYDPDWRGARASLVFTP
ncbi:MAG TPA: response regulator [Caulobacteraceae bacterium]|jgi:two-component sensor histidine kinase